MTTRTGNSRRTAVLPGSRAPRRPGVVTVAAVLAFAQAGITLLPTVTLFRNLFTQKGVAPTELALDRTVAIAQLLGVVLLIVGGVLILRGQGRGVLVAGAALEIAISVFWIVRIESIDSAGISLIDAAKGLAIGVAIVFAIMPATSLVLSLGATTTQFLRRGHWAAREG